MTVVMTPTKTDFDRDNMVKWWSNRVTNDLMQQGGNWP